jgi:hypothetical protein
VILLSFGALATGAGIYAQWFWRAPDPPAYAPFLLAGGILLVVVYAFYAPSPGAELVVGELGIGVEREGKLTHTAWYEIEQLTFVHRALVARTGGKPIQVAIKDHPDAARLIVAEAMERIPDRVDLDDDDVARIGSPAGDAGELRAADPPQVTDLTCRASDMPLNIEKDVRMCAGCGVLYHRKSVPNRCVECARRFKST